jgi:hypothetical protein
MRPVIIGSDTGPPACPVQSELNSNGQTKVPVIANQVGPPIDLAGVAARAAGELEAHVDADLSDVQEKD